jgi:hypothetical protein
VTPTITIVVIADPTPTTIPSISPIPTAGVQPQVKQCQFNKEQMTTLMKQYGYSDADINTFFTMKPDDCYNINPRANNYQQPDIESSLNNIQQKQQEIERQLQNTTNCQQEMSQYTDCINENSQQLQRYNDCISGYFNQYCTKPFTRYCFKPICTY